MSGTWQRIHASLKGPQSEQDKRHTDLKCSQTENEHGLDLRKIISTKLCTAIQKGRSGGTFSTTEEKAALGNPGRAHVPAGWVCSLNGTWAAGSGQQGQHAERAPESRERGRLLEQGGGKATGGREREVGNPARTGGRLLTSSVKGEWSARQRGQYA